MTHYKVKLVPLNDHNAEGRWTTVEASTMKCGTEIGSEYVVSYHKEQPFYMNEFYTKPEFTLE